MEGVSLLFREISAAEEPSLALVRGLFAMTIATEGEIAMGYEVWDDDLCGLGGDGGSQCGSLLHGCLWRM